MAGRDYWAKVDPVWDKIDIYTSPEVFLATYNAAPRDAALLYAAHFCQSEVCNGGFAQFFWNSTGVLAPEAIEGFKAIGMRRIARLIERAMSRLSPYSRSREKRQLQLDTSDYRFFEDLDEEFFRLIVSENGGFEAAADRFAHGKGQAH